MKKAQVFWIILDLIFIILFNAFYFVFVYQKATAASWVSYAFIHFSYLMLIFTPFFITKSKNTDIFGFSLYTISSLYFLIELITGIVFIFNTINYIYSLIVQLCLAGLYGILLLSHMIANEHTATSTEERISQINFVKYGSGILNELLNNCENVNYKKQIEKIYDLFYSSQVKSNPELSKLESEIINKIENLSSLIEKKNDELFNNECIELTKLINERTKKLRLLN
ncbi:hypothetical protein K7I13_08790 [Brucepastera parasyntrophica]|uniref:hypothetical protein n=1 Tax=Brucepastera parasyntrophica TaxID=2880008 RepID=UPI00210C7E07|nr:hypothetical protein [Brucepastera parasyntrophica]ULQ58657.1 hypothetical protein K7I13_08790 [Brucepastera parasyntrophica]